MHMDMLYKKICYKYQENNYDTNFIPCFSRSSVSSRRRCDVRHRGQRQYPFYEQVTIGMYRENWYQNIENE